MASPPNIGGHLLSNNANINNNNIKKSGYLKKQKHGHKRYFVLREPSEGSPARLEYYESEKKWKNKSAPKRVIPLDSCLNINKRADAKHKHLIALYTKDEYFAVAAENEQEQENWYGVLTDLMGEGKVYDGSASNSASSLVGFDEANYGMITPATAAYKEVWQVNLKSKGLGQSRNLTGVFRLCLSSRTISFVKLNSEVASVILQLMNIRRCGHSDSFFFIEVGRSAATGPGELWMQADDSVVAQNIHETILEAMKAMKELSEFRPRSKSQSSSTNPISVPTRRHLNNLPPSQTGLIRRSRTDSMATSSPVSKFSSCRIRTASEGDGTMTRPMSVNGSPLSPGVHRTLLGRSNTITARPCRTFESSSLQHSKSMSMALSPSPPGPATPIPGGRASCGEIRDSGAHRHASCSASPSPSDAGFLSCEEYGSSPADLRLTLRSNTPESLGAETPPGRDPAALHGYMVMERSHGGYRPLSELEKAYRKRTYSLTTPRQQRIAPQVSSASLDEYTLMRATYVSGGGQSDRRSRTTSPKVCHPEDYVDAPLSGSAGGHLGDSGYMPMTPGVAPPRMPVGRDEAYVPMSAMCVSAPKQIINPRSHPIPAGQSLKMDSPGSLSLEDSGYMRMWCGNRMSVESADGKLTSGEYLNMSPVDLLLVSSATPPDYLHGDVTPLPRRQPYTACPLPRPLKATPPQRGLGTDADQYVLMSLQRQSIKEESNYCPIKEESNYCPIKEESNYCPIKEESDYCPISPGGSGYSTSTPPSSSSSSSLDPSPLSAGGQGDGGLVLRGRVSRPTRLALESLRTLPCMSEHPLPAEARSPGEYINIDFGAADRPSPASWSTTDGPAAAASLGKSPPFFEATSADVRPGTSPGSAPLSSYHASLPDGGEEQTVEEETGTRDGDVKEETRAEERVCLPCPAKDDYTEMTFSPVGPPPPAPAPHTDSPLLPASPRTCVPPVPVEAFFLGGPSLSVPPSLDPDRGAKVIRADPQGRRRHSSETFSSTTTVTPVCPSFAHEAKRHSSASVENVWRPVRSSEGSDEEYGSGGSPMCRETSAGFQNGLNYIALNLMEGSLGGCSLTGCEGLLRYKTACGCKGGMNGFSAGPFASLGFKETVTVVKD